MFRNGKCLGEQDVSWLTKLFNEILLFKKMLDVQRNGTLVPNYKNNDDIHKGEGAKMILNFTQNCVSKY